MRCPLHKVAPVVAVCMKLHNLIIDHQNSMAAAQVDCDEVVEYAAVVLNNGQRRNFKKTYHAPRVNKHGAPIELLEIAARSPHGIVTSTTRRDLLTKQIFNNDACRRPAF
jgi:hypothetical protein